MSEVCECGHLKSEHEGYVRRQPEKEGERSYLEWVAQGEGECGKCKCKKFRKSQQTYCSFIKQE